MWMQILQGLAYALTAANAADQMMTDNSSNIQTPGAPAGGSSQPQAQQFFSQGQPLRAPNQPSPVVPETSPMLSAQIGQLLAGTPVAGSAYQLNIQPDPMANNEQNLAQTADSIYGKAKLQRDIAGTLNDTPQAGTNGVVGNLGNAAEAIKAMAPLLFPEINKSLTLGGAAGGQPGQNIFQLPQRQTLAQILASLPRTM